MAVLIPVSWISTVALQLSFTLHYPQIPSSAVFNCITGGKKCNSHTCNWKTGPVLALFVFTRCLLLFKVSTFPLSAIRLTSLLPIIPNRLLLYPSIWNHGCVTPLVRRNGFSFALKVSTPIPTWQQLTAVVWFFDAWIATWLGIRHSEQ